MNILLDECVDRRLARNLAGHAVATVPQKGWSGIKNGDLLALAEKEFDVFITVDRSYPSNNICPAFRKQSSCFVRRPIGWRISVLSRRQCWSNLLVFLPVP